MEESRARQYLERSHFIHALVSLHFRFPFSYLMPQRPSHFPISHQSPLHMLTQIRSAVEINVAIICGCLPSVAAYISHHRELFSSLRSHIRLPSVSFRKYTGKSSQQSSSEGVVSPKRLPSTEEDSRYHALTLGSAVRHEGKLYRMDDATQLVKSQYLSGGDYGLQSGQYHREGKSPNQTARNDFELRSFPGGSVEDEKLAQAGTVV